MISSFSPRMTPVTFGHQKAFQGLKSLSSEQIDTMLDALKSTQIYGKDWDDWSPFALKWVSQQLKELVGTGNIVTRQSVYPYSYGLAMLTQEHVDVMVNRLTDLTSEQSRELNKQLNEEIVRERKQQRLELDKRLEAYTCHDQYCFGDGYRS